jgi:hypothetical protein
MRLKFVSGWWIVSLLVGSLLGACGSSDDKRKAGRPDAMAGAGGEVPGEGASGGGSGGNSGEGPSGDAGTPTIPQGGEPTEENGGAGGQAAVAEFHGLYVGVDGDDTAAGTETEPFETLARAADVAVAGDTIVFLDGSYTVSGQPVTIPSGVDVIAQNAGMVTLNGNGATTLFSLTGDTRLAGLTFVTAGRVALSSQGTLEIHDSVFTNCATSCLDLSGSAQAVVVGAEGELLGNGGGAFATLQGTASLAISGGVLENYGAGGIVRATGEATVELADVQVKDGTGLVLSLKNGAKGLVSGATVATKSQVLFEQADTSELSVSDSDLSIAGGVTAFHCFYVPATAKLGISRSKLHGCGTGVKGAIPVELELTDTEFYDLSFGGADLDTGGPNPGGRVLVDGCSFHDVTYVAMRIGNGQPLLDLKMRNTVIDVTTLANWHALSIVASAASTIDLGTLAEPGNNTFLQHTAALATAVAIPSQAVTVQAVGNTWTPQQQGADDTGHYVVKTGKELKDSAAVTTGINYIKPYTTSTIVLAQVP